MGKKVKRKTYTSKGERASVSRSVVKAVRKDRPETEKALHKLDAWRKGKNPWITIKGPSSNMPFVRVRANTQWGDPKKQMANLFGGKADG